MHKVFISYHHGNDQLYKDHLVELNSRLNLFIDRSIRDGFISDSLPAQVIREQIRDRWLRDSTVTVLLVGRETKYRKHVDWELKSSMINGLKNQRSGLLVLMLPDTITRQQNRGPRSYTWYMAPRTRSDFATKYPCMPERIIDNLIDPNVVIEVIPYLAAINDPYMLASKIADAHSRRDQNRYDLSRSMRKNNGSAKSFLFGS